MHISLNFPPGEQLTDETFVAISHRYMEGLQMDDQLYLNYRKGDAKHPHIHFVSTLITAKGKIIPTQSIGVRLSEPTGRDIEKEFRLIPAEDLHLQMSEATVEQITSALRETQSTI